jgi:membrane protein implicated in regulation of membrane protease activity
MTDFAWIGWVVFGIILIIAEIFTPGFVLLWFGIGALAAGLAAMLGLDSLTAQFVIFLLASSALTAASRTIFSNYFVREGDEAALKSGTENLPGQIGVVSQDSAGALNEGAVKVFGSTWTAFPVKGELPLKAGEQVLVESIKGAKIYVRRISAEPDWRQTQALPEGEPKHSEE